ncbi:CRISPR-associated endonuclease Cas2 [Thermosulfurimonas dismutans]|uniref:CRISPR-associated endoribonuclease Cas2 n=1 Tax=Thermosulfurimonas dismutans TaxID=999894 RepID=A0A179D448_9BACT|nr:CRISPR-associated endonuclease Cas2 [Thermosulfurimonas dismutans]OAQ20753.1 CRISPR-associated protein Cas2 [Thermosulfurimonas dismutans]
MSGNYYLVCYDIADEKRLRKVARVMEDFGIRVLYSVFECRLTPEEFVVMRQAVEGIIDALEDKVRYYRLCETCRHPVIHLGYGKHTRLPEGDHMIF